MHVTQPEPPSLWARLKNAFAVGLLWAFLYAVVTYACLILPTASKPGICNAILDYGSLPGLSLTRLLKGLPPNGVILVVYLGSILFWLLVGAAGRILARRLWLAVVIAAGLGLMTILALAAIRP